MLPDLQRVVRELAPVQLARWPQHAARRDETVPSDGHGDRRRGVVTVAVAVAVAVVIVGGFFGGSGARCGWLAATDQIPADAHRRLDHGASAQNDVLRAVELRPSCDFVARVGLDVVAFA